MTNEMWAQLLARLLNPNDTFQVPSFKEMLIEIEKMEFFIRNKPRTEY